MTTAEEIKELFELTTQRVAQIETESAREIAQIRKETESIRKEIEAETTQKVAKIEEETAQIRKETEDIRKDSENGFNAIIGIMKDTELLINNTSKHLGFYTNNVANISEEYFYRGLKSSMTVGDMTFKNILKNIKIDEKEYDIILENDEAVMLVSVKTNINSNNIRKDLLKDIIILKNSSRYKSTDKKFYATIAGFTGGDNEHLLNLAKKKGVLILALSGEHQPTLVNAEVSPTVY